MKSNIEILIGKCLSGNATTDEIKQLEEWKNASEENNLIYKKNLKAWEKCETGITPEVIQQDKFKVESAYSNYLARKVRKISRLSFIYKIAAILAFPLALAISWYLFVYPGDSDKITENICSVTSPKGHVSKCILPDGTGVWVNTGSAIEYNTASYNKKNRAIHLEGEAYFEVTSNKDKPFKVITPFGDVNATGTAFNVIAYPEEKTFETVLSEGSVQVQFKSGRRRSLNMKPGQRVIMDMSDYSLDVHSVEPEMFTSWRNGELIFKDATLNDLVKELERIYDIKFYMNPESLGDLRFRGMFSYDNNLILALEKIKKTSGVDYYIENKEVWLKKSNLIKNKLPMKQ
jgi:transmembrane sensor